MGNLMYHVDLMLNAKLTPQDYDFERGVEDFLNLLSLLHKTPGFDVDWDAQENDEHGVRYSVWENPEGYLGVLRKANTAKLDLFSIWATEASDALLYDLKYRWNDWAPDHIIGEINHPHPIYGTHADLYIRLIDAVTAWKRPQHLTFGPGVYMRDFHPLDRARVGIRWMGWLPFDLSPSDVPEAEIVQPMNGGTLVVTQSQFWQALDAHPDYSRQAIERAQEVEIRLNLLGVLPTNLELMRGDWGQR